MPPDTQSFHANSTPDVMIVDEPINVPASPIETATDMVNVGNNVGHSLPKLSNDDDVVIVHPSTSSERSAPRMIRFNVQYCDRIIPIDIPDTGTVGKCGNDSASNMFVFHLELDKLRIFTYYQELDVCHISLFRFYCMFSY